MEAMMNGVIFWPPGTGLKGKPEIPTFDLTQPPCILAVISMTV